MGNSGHKTSLILQGGAMKGMFSCGVIDVLMENNITFDAGVGISAGAVFGCNYKSRQIGRPIRYNKKYCKDKRYCSFKSLRKTGDLYGAEFCYKTLPDELDVFDRKTYRENSMKFYVGATNIDSGECEFAECADGDGIDMKWFQASASMPVVSKPVEIGDSKYLDGGIANSVPFEYMESLGYNKNIIVLTVPKGYRLKKPKHKLLLKYFLRKLPKIKQLVLDRHLMYNRQMDEIDRRENDNISLVVRPPKRIKIGMREKDPKKLEKVYNMGREEALKRLPEILEFLKQND